MVTEPLPASLSDPAGDGLCCGRPSPSVRPASPLLVSWAPALPGWPWVRNLGAYLGARLVWVGPVSNTLTPTSVSLWGQGESGTNGGGSSISLVVFGARLLLLCQTVVVFTGEEALMGWVRGASTSWAQVRVGVHLGSVGGYEAQTGLEPVIGSGSGSVALWWRVLPSLWDRGWDSPGFLRPTGLRQLSPFYREAGDGSRQHSLSITVIAGGFYEPVMGSESGQLSVLLSQLGDLLMGGGGGARCHELRSGSLLCRGCPVCAQLQQAGWAQTSGRTSQRSRWGETGL